MYGLDSGEDVREVRLNCQRDQLFWNVKISDSNFAEDAVLFAEMLDILIRALQVLNEESDTLDHVFLGQN